MRERQVTKNMLFKLDSAFLKVIKIMKWNIASLLCKTTRVMLSTLYY